jgi:hypothetical protein
MMLDLSTIGEFVGASLLAMTALFFLISVACGVSVRS